MTALDKIRPAEKRPGEIKCCLVEVDGKLVRIPEDVARKSFSPPFRYYYMDGVSYGNLLKNMAEMEGRERQYENYPGVNN